MSGLLIRVLSTGRAGTKFLSAAFADQGYHSFHEDLYLGEPYSAVMQYLYMLGDLWKTDREAYYRLHSDFAEPYVHAVGEAIESSRTTVGKSLPLWSRLFGADESKCGYVIHTAQTLTPATPLIERELEKAGIKARTLVLYRNPLKTIHAIYLVEGKFREDQTAYPMRPSSFREGETGFLGAASVWANLYAMALDQSRHYGAEKFHLLELERFSSEFEYTRQIFEFTGLEFDSDRFRKFSQQELSKPLRAAKVDSARNSHLFHNPDFVFSMEQIFQIQTRLSQVVKDYGIDWDHCVTDYLTFHASEKNKLGFK